MAIVVSVKKSIVLEINDEEGKALYDVLCNLAEEVKGVSYVCLLENSRKLDSLRCVLHRYYDDDLPF
jgi:hypothetical protein